MIDWLNTQNNHSEFVIVSYYVDAARLHSTTASEILRAFVKQIIIHYKESSMPMLPDLHSKIEAVLTSATSVTTSISDLAAIVQHFLQLQPSCFLIVDGIDALPESEILVFVSFLRQLWSAQPDSNPCGRLMLLCRETLGRRISLERIPASIILQVKLKYLQPDIHVYVDSEVDKKQQEYPITNDDALVDEIKSVLKLNSEKM